MPRMLQRQLSSLTPFELVDAFKQLGNLLEETFDLLRKQCVLHAQRLCFG